MDNIPIFNNLMAYLCNINCFSIIFQGFLFDFCEIKIWFWKYSGFIENNLNKVFKNCGHSGMIILKMLKICCFMMQKGYMKKRCSLWCKNCPTIISYTYPSVWLLLSFYLQAVPSFSSITTVCCRTICNPTVWTPWTWFSPELKICWWMWTRIW